MSKFLNISTDNTLGGNSASDETVSSQKAVKDYIDSHSGGSVDIDNLSITTNSSNELQAVGVINQNNTSTAIKTWTGTKAQYDAIVSKDSNTLYNITDDADLSLHILEALYPVGSIYITTASTCPLVSLISGSTWELVSSGRVLQGADSNHAVGTTAEAGLPNITGEFGTDLKYNAGSYNASGAISTLLGNENSFSVRQAETNTNQVVGFSLNASASNPIYGNSSTVQPPAYFVNIWERTA
ncbi:MAG: hypothetical protein J6S67_22315 [Methanobrevibacter sp.]|nr:hypothetical protein [Methanobrevibacter sp.]